ncbi:hypothetical protein WICPIJ_000337, partial [Wickerhamomyces pijperi]
EKPRFQMISPESDDSDADAAYEDMTDEGEDEYYDDDEVEEIDEEEAKLFDSYFKSGDNAFGSFNLADKIMAKLEETKQ